MRQHSVLLFLPSRKDEKDGDRKSYAKVQFNSSICFRQQTTHKNERLLLMHYLEAMRRIVEIQNLFSGGFIKTMGDVEAKESALTARSESFSTSVELISAGSTLPSDTQEVLFERAKQMKTLIDEDRIGFGELFRFNMEYDTVCLLLVLFVCGRIRDDVPISEKDIGRIDSAIGDFVTAGFSQEGESVFAVIRDLFIKLRQSHSLPTSVLGLLADNES